jgi:hypothetical protein
MSLSDRERRLLAEMEAALATDDPRLESRLAGSTMTPTKPRLALGALSILAETSSRCLDSDFPCPETGKSTSLLHSLGTI